MTSSTVSPASLASWIDAQPVFLGADWLRELDGRKRAEVEFHDSLRAQDSYDDVTDETSNARFYLAAAPLHADVRRWLGRVAPGKRFLDYACGDGGNAILAAGAGARLAVGIDISAVSVQRSAANADSAGVADRTRFLQRDCEATQLPDDSFDACLCSGMLHHLDLSRALPELHRIMAPGGRILCVEALGYNPLIRWYRNRTPELRTQWEKDHILTLAELRFARRWFDVRNVRFHLMAAPAAVLVPKPLRSVAIGLGHLLDAVLTRVPLVQRLSWQFTFELVKRA
jgi:SAM-dependent methyltransferase